MQRVVTTGSSRDIIVDRVTGLHGPDDFIDGVYRHEQHHRHDDQYYP